MDLNTEIDTDGRNTETRSDLGSAFGDWETVREQVLELGRACAGPRGHRRAVRVAQRRTRSGDAVRRRVPRARDGRRGRPRGRHRARRRAAQGRRRRRRHLRRHRNINFTNICYTGCRFCAFRAAQGGRGRVHVVGRGSCGPGVGGARRGRDRGLHAGRHRPRAAGHRVRDLVRAVKRRVPSMHVHAFSPMEIVNGASRGGQSVRDWLTELRAAGLDTIPGTAAEILDDEAGSSPRASCPHRRGSTSSPPRTRWDCGRVRR